MNLSDAEIHKNIRTLCARYNILSIRDITYVDQGVGSQIYRVASECGVFGVKICLYPERREKAMREITIRTSLLSQGLQFVPRPLYFDDKIFPNSALIFQFIDGIFPDFTNPHTLRTLAVNLSQLHQLDLTIVADGFSLALQHYQTLCELVTSSLQQYPHLISDTFAQGLQQALHEIHTSIITQQPCFYQGIISRLHGDLSDNFIQDASEKLWFIDWENSCIGNTIEEVLCIPYDLNFSPAQEQQFYDLYREYFAPARDIDFQAIKNTYRCMNPLYALCWNFNFIDVYTQNHLDPTDKYQALHDAIRESAMYLSRKTIDMLMSGMDHLTSHRVRLCRAL